MGQYYVIIPVYNRKYTTLRCLETLRRNGDLKFVKIVVVDDASSDGTSAAVMERFPEVHVLHGNGFLWWGGGISVGMEWALSQEDCVGIVWLNDDCRPRMGVIPGLVSYARENACIATAQSVTHDGFTYGGHRKSFLGLYPVPASKSDSLPADACNGNCVAFPRQIIEEVGAFSAKEFPQNFGDADYTLRATALGFQLTIVCGLICDNDTNIHLSHARWTDCSISARSIISTWRSPRSLLFPSARFSFYRKHWGIWGWGLATLVYFRFAFTMLVRGMLAK